MNEQLEAQAAKRRAWKAEAEIMSQFSEVLEDALRMYWPDREITGVAGGISRQTLDAIKENIPGDSGPSWPPYENLDELFDIQANSRLLCGLNEFAKGAIKNRCNFVVGFGHTVSFEAKEGFELTTEEKASLKDVWTKFEKRNRWRMRSRANQRRLDRDGEVFLRKFRTKDGLVLRYVEPRQVRPPDEAKEDHPYGIAFDPMDDETAVLYYVAIGEEIVEVKAEEIQHRKLDDDFECARGVPLLMSALRSLAGAATIQRNVTALTKIQSAVAWIRKHHAATQATLHGIIAGRAEVEIQNPRTGQTEYGREESRPGKIIDTTPDTEFEFPSAASNVETFLKAKDSSLRAAAASVVMPEYMFTADASNGNYASTMVAESPSVKEFEGQQYDAIDWDRELIEEELDLAVKRNVISEDLRERVEVRIAAPDTAVRDQLAMADVRLKDRDLGVSQKTLITESGRDFETEMENNKELQDELGDVPGAALPLGGSVPGELEREKAAADAKAKADALKNGALTGGA